MANTVENMANDKTFTADFKNSVLTRQAANNAANPPADKKETERKLDKLIVAIDENGEKTLVSTEKHSDNITTQLKDMKNILTNISTTLEKSLGVNGHISAKLDNVSTKFEKDENKQEDKKFLVDTVMEGMSGIKSSLDKGLGKVGNLMSDSFGKLSETYKKAGGGSYGAGFTAGDVLGGGWRGAKSKIGSIGDAFKAGRAEGGFGMGAGRAVAAISPTAAGALSSGMGYVGNAIKTAGPLATAAGIGLSALNLVDTVQDNANRSSEIEKSVAAGAMTRNQGNVAQGEAYGGTAGTAFGAAIGGIAGSALGPLGAALGAWAGGKIGNFAGGVVGKYGVKAYQGIKSMFGFGETPEQERAKMTPEQQDMNKFVNGEMSADEYNKQMKLRDEGGAAPAPESPTSAPTATNTPQNPPSPAVITAIPEQTQAKSGTGVWDNIKSGAGWFGDKASSAGSAVMGAGAMAAGKASEWGTGIKNWFGESKLGQAIADRNKDVSDFSGPRGSAEANVGTAANVTTMEDASGSSRQSNQGIVSERSAFGKSWLGRLMAGKGTETEQFLAQSEKSSADAEGKNEKTDYSQFMGSRKSGGWFGKDTYTIGEDEVDKATYMKAKKVAEEGGDASQIQGMIDKYKDAKASNDAALYESNTNAMGDTTGYNPNATGGGGGWFSGLGTKIKNFFTGGKSVGPVDENKFNAAGDYTGVGNDTIQDYASMSNEAKEYQKLKLQQASADAMRAGGGNTYVDVDPETKAKQEAMRKKTEELGSKLSAEERKQVERNIAPEQPKVKTEKDVIDLQAKYGKKDKKEDLITSTPAVEPSAASTGDTVYGKSTETQSAREDASASKNTASNIVVNAPVNNNTTQQQSIRSPFRNEDPTVNRYVDSRFA